MFAAYMDPHDPYFVHPYDGSGYARAAHPRPALEEAAELSALYDGEIAFWDSHFGSLIDDLKSRGLYDDMTIVVTSDHGEEFADHGGFWHGTTLYDEQVRVPLLLKLPQGRRAGTTVGHWVQSVDIMPTLLGEVGVALPDGIQGASLFEGSDRVFAEESHEGNQLESVRQRQGTDEWKLITSNRGNPRGLAPVELYDVVDDPGEREDRSGDAARVESMTESLLEASRAARLGAVERTEVQVDETAREHLEAIGYVQSEAE